MKRVWKMGMIRCYATVAALGLAVAVGGCAKKTVQGGEAVHAGGQLVAGAEGETLLTESPGSETLDRQTPNSRSSWPLLPVYFDFDQASIRKDQVGSVENNGDFLKKNPQVRVRIEGNCDERGTAEYNLALGERRARSVRKYLLALGVAPERLESLSLGEERPLVDGSDEEAMAQNRRADFVILN